MAPVNYDSVEGGDEDTSESSVGQLPKTLYPVKLKKRGSNKKLTLLFERSADAHALLSHSAMMAAKSD